MVSKRTYLTAIVAALVCALAPAPVPAQSEQPKIEWSTQYSALHLSDFDTWMQGVGTRGSFNFNRHVSLEGEVNFLFPRGAVNPSSAVAIPSPFYLGERATQGLFGVKAGVSGSKFGLFGKLRPGLIHFNKSSCQGGVIIDGRCYGSLIPGSTCRDANGNIIPCLQSLAGENRFALDLGGVIEFYPTRRFVIRMDLGDTLIRNSQPGQTSHNLQLGTGFGIRF
jgi:hypothetical protein